MHQREQPAALHPKRGRLRREMLKLVSITPRGPSPRKEGQHYEPQVPPYTPLQHSAQHRFSRDPLSKFKDSLSKVKLY